MLESLEAIEHPGEVVRLFLVMAHCGKARMEEQALLEACKRTAGLSSRYPRPAPAIAVATATGLLSRSDGTLSITDRGRKFASQGTSGSVDLAQPQAMLLLAAMLDDTIVYRAIASVVGNFQLLNGQLHARRNSIQADPEQILFCRLLQQLGAISVSGDYYVMPKAFGDLLAQPIIQSAKLSQAELLQQLELQRRRADLAEQAVVEIEKNRLKALDRPHLAARVDRISLHDVSAGYDIASFEKNERPRLIEVKSSVGSQITFDWSAGERATAAKHPDAYFIYFVPFSYTLPELICPVVPLRNPIDMIQAGRLIEAPTGFRVSQPPKP